jgi:hypothetical protein
LVPRTDFTICLYRLEINFQNNGIKTNSYKLISYSLFSMLNPKPANSLPAGTKRDYAIATRIEAWPGAGTVR